MLPSIPFAPFHISHLVRRLNVASAEADRRRLERQGLRDMAGLDDHMLADIGLHRGDLEHVSRLPAQEDRSGALWRLSRGNR